jgi:hypothetical protein
MNETPQEDTMNSDETTSPPKTPQELQIAFYEESLDRLHSCKAELEATIIKITELIILLKYGKGL